MWRKQNLVTLRTNMKKLKTTSRNLKSKLVLITILQSIWHRFIDKVTTFKRLSAFGRSPGCFAKHFATKFLKSWDLLGDKHVTLSQKEISFCKIYSKFGQLILHYKISKNNWWDQLKILLTSGFFMKGHRSGTSVENGLILRLTPQAVIIMLTTFI